MPKEDITITPLWIYTREHYSAMRQDEILSFATMWMVVENIMLGKINQSEKLRTIFHSYVGYKTEMHRHNSMMVTRQKGYGE